MPEASNIHFIQNGSGDVPVFWGHGWGQSHKGLLPLTQSLEKHAKNIVVDFPGFGDSPAPSDAWGTEEYADDMAEFIKAHAPGKKIFWVGHSFGCRVGLQLAARHPDLIAGLFLIAGAGLPRKRSIFKSVYFWLRIRLYKFLKALIPFGLPENWLMKTFGSADYKSAGEMRKIFVKVVNEDLSRIAETINCPVMLMYGSDDDETPPDIGERLNSLIPNSKLVILDGFDHYSILTTGRHKVIQKLNSFIRR